MLVDELERKNYQALSSIEIQGIIRFFMFRYDASSRTCNIVFIVVFLSKKEYSMTFGRWYICAV